MTNTGVRGLTDQCPVKRKSIRKSNDCCEFRFGRLIADAKLNV
jgi:hypothetical protein